MNFNKIPAGKEIPNDIYAIIEIPAYSKPIKYEIDKNTGALFVNRIMNNSMFYPCNYGYINETLSLDNDPVDIMIQTPHPLQIGSVIRCKPIGMLKMIDESGEDNKIIAIPHHTITKEYENIRNIDHFPHLLKEKIVHFFKYYKKLDSKKWTKIEGWEDSNAAKNEILTSFHRAQSKKNKI